MLFMDEAYASADPNLYKAWEITDIENIIVAVLDQIYLNNFIEKIQS
jgi:hypothetical protein